MTLEQHLRRETVTFADLVKDLDPEAWVPTTPDWRLRVLVAHIGQAPRWAAEIVRTRSELPVPDPHDADPGSPDGWPDWLIGGMEELVEAVNDGPSATVWTMVGAQPASFWIRRLTCDLVVHRADAALLAGVPYEVEPALAAEVVSEVLDLFTAFRLLPGAGETMLLAPDEAESWLVTRTPSGVEVERGADAGTVVVSGPVRDLMLVLSRRLPPEIVKVTGDQDVLARWLAETPS
ncbi:maleylpyruvate isomerase family mycothiol-dependent enzyme [Kibdelosporangium lantanae]